MQDLFQKILLFRIRNLFEIKRRKSRQKLKSHCLRLLWRVNISIARHCLLVNFPSCALFSFHTCGINHLRSDILIEDDLICPYQCLDTRFLILGFDFNLWFFFCIQLFQVCFCKFFLFLRLWLSTFLYAKREITFLITLMIGDYSIWIFIN